MVQAHGEPAANAGTGESLRPLSEAELTDDVIWGLVDAAPDGLVMVDEQGLIVLVNRQAEEAFGYERGELLGKPIETLVPPALRSTHIDDRTGYRDDPRVRAMGSGLDLHGYRKGGSEIPVEISLSPLRTGDRLRVIAAVRDITGRKAAETRLRHAEAELHTLADRERIARDLHDTVIQRLFAAGLALQATATRVGDADVGRRIENVVDQLDETIRELRYAIFGLEARGAGAGFREEIVRVVSEEQKGLPFEPKLVIDGSLESVDDDAAAQLLATLREALSNVARHAKATSAEVRVEVGTDLRLRVIDDGRGFDPSAVPDGHLGLAGMRSRAERLGGRITVTTAHGEGTTIEVVVPEVVPERIANVREDELV